jgi:hypothetical protein
MEEGTDDKVDVEVADRVSSAVGRAEIPVLQVARSESLMLGPHVARVELWAPRGAQPKSWVLHGAWSKSAKKAMKEPRRA